MSRFHRIAIVNRGEPAMRLITAVRELNTTRDQPLRTIALYTRPDRRAKFVREADEAHNLGEATYVDESDGSRRSAYLDYQRLRKALLATRADAVWVGWGFVAEHAAFADLCKELGVAFIGPSGDVMRKLGDKITSKQIAEAADVPVAPWSGSAVNSLEEARVHAKRLGYPLMIKATAGGGGRGIRRVASDEQLAGAYDSARAEARFAFGDSTVFLERLVAGARHVEVQIIADGTGTTWALGVRDCSVQRRNQKLLEESPSPALTAEQDRFLRDAAARLGASAGYQNAGTVEFLYDPDTKSFAFMEVNARLQVEHPVTEMCTGADLVKLQIHIASGGKLDPTPPTSRGHAIEARINAEAPAEGFAPAPGVIELLRLPSGPGIRVDTGVAEGDDVPPDFDSMIAKVIAHGRDREEAISRLGRALYEMALVVRGGANNKGFILDLLSRPEVVSGEVHVGWLDGLVDTGEHVRSRYAEEAMIAAALGQFEEQKAIERRRFYALAARGRPTVSDKVGQTIELGFGGSRYGLHVRRLGMATYAVAIEGHEIEVERTARTETGVRLRCGAYTWRYQSTPRGAAQMVEVEGIPHRVTNDSGGMVRALAPAVVSSVAVTEGQSVEAGDRIAVVEAMKTETTIAAPFAGVVSKIYVVPNVQVDAGAPIVQLEAAGDDDSAGGDDARLDFARLAAHKDHCADRQLATLRRLVLGFDANSKELARRVAEHGTLCPEAAADDPELWAAENEVLDIFADIAVLFRRDPLDEPMAHESDTEYLLLYTSDIGGRGEALPVTFVDALRRALAHYGVSDLEPTELLRESVFRTFKAHDHWEASETPILSILQRWRDQIDDLKPRADARLHQRLQRVIVATQGRFPALKDLARDIRYRYFERPLLEEARKKVYADVARRLDERGEIEPLVHCPQPLMGFFCRRLHEADADERRLMLEALARRHYRTRPLQPGEHLESDGVELYRTRYAYQGKTICLTTALTTHDRLPDVVTALLALANTTPAEEDVVIDFYVWCPDGIRAAEAELDTLVALLSSTKVERAIRRVVFGLAAPHGGLELGSADHFTFRHQDGEFVIDPRYPRLNPMVGKRLQLWRFDNFDIRRVPTMEDVYLFHLTAHDNPKDERLYALAEVRDLTPVKNDAGRVTALPHLEHMLMDALASIRVFQAARPARRRLYWNRVRLIVWPPLMLARDEISQLAYRLGPATRGLGLEMVEVSARIPDEQGGLREQRIEIAASGNHGLGLRYRPLPTKPLEPLSPVTQKVVRCRQRGLMYPYELLDMLTPSRDEESQFPHGEFVEHDLDDSGERLVLVDRPPGNNTANVVAGLLTHFTDKVPEGMTRVVLLGDPSGSMGSLAETECRIINAALALAREKKLPVEWVAVSAGARIAMDSGTENMDWIALTLRRIVEFTQAGGKINIIVAGINVGAQPYWNAEATMLMHTKGVLIQTAQGAMVLTGKRALDYSGGVSAEDNFGIGGFDRVMGPNGQAQYFAADLPQACELLLRHYEHTYVVPGERFPRRAATNDPNDRDVSNSPHPSDGFSTVGDVFSERHNPARKRPFDVRRIMRATTDSDHEPLPRWQAMRDAETSVIWDAHIGGIPVCLIGLASRPQKRLGFVPADGPEHWTSGTLFPLSSKKIARAINASSGNRPLVVLANLSGFDGSPESMRNWQLEYGAEIGRAVVNFDGPIVFTVISRYHGGAFVVFSARLNQDMEVAALEGTKASVIGGAPAAAVVFAREVQKRTQHDPRVQAAQEALVAASGVEKVRVRARLAALMQTVNSEKLGEVADEFDGVHSVHRARDVGSVHRIIPTEQLRPYLIDALERGMARVRERHAR